MQRPVVSVVVPLYNKVEFVGETLDSVLDRQGVATDVLVVDDGSTDGSWEVASAYADRIRLHRAGGGSAARARNLGARLARGEWLIFLDADDLLAPGTLGAMVAALDGATDRFAACEWQRLRCEAGGWVAYSPEKPLQPPGGDPVAAWLGNWYIPPCAVLWPRPLFEASGGWDAELAATDDEELMIRMLLRGTPIVPVADGCAFYRFFGAGGTLSTRDVEPLVRGRLLGLDKIRAEAARRGQLERYARDIGMAYYRLARSYAAGYPDLVLECLGRADELLGRAGVPGPWVHRLAAGALGLQRKERLVRWVTRHLPIRRPPHTAAG